MDEIRINNLRTLSDTGYIELKRSTYFLGEIAQEKARSLEYFLY